MKSKADQDRLDKIHFMPCILCMEIDKAQPSSTEGHHLVDGGYRKHSGGDQATIPLCGWHHRASCKFFGGRRSSVEMLHMYGPSLKYQGKIKGFVERWGTERELLAKVNALIGG